MVVDRMIINILLLIGVICFISCNGRRNRYINKVNTNDSYNINYYVDTINGHVILSTVASSTNSNNISISTLELSN